MTRSRHLPLLRILAATTLVAIVVIGIWRFPLKSWAEQFITWIRRFGTPGAAIYGLVYAAGVIFMVPGIALTAGAGLVYGPVIGVLIVSPASVLGATLAFLVARYFVREWVEGRLIHYPKFTAIDRSIGKHGFRIVLLLRLQPVLPFVLLNYALGLTRVRLRDYVLASWIGMAPATIVYVYLGSALYNVVDLFSGKIFRQNFAAVLLFWVGLAAAIVLMIVVSRMAKRALDQEMNEPGLQGEAG